jgi:ABC-type microcin C transport system permease subunit YejE
MHVGAWFNVHLVYVALRVPYYYQLILLAYSLPEQHFLILFGLLLLFGEMRYLLHVRMHKRMMATSGQ